MRLADNLVLRSVLAPQLLLPRVRSLLKQHHPALQVDDAHLTRVIRAVAVCIFFVLTCFVNQSRRAFIYDAAHTTHSSVY